MAFDLERVERGIWQIDGFPPAVVVEGRLYHRADIRWARPMTLCQYREAVPTHARHMLVYAGWWEVDHIDERNPSEGLLGALGHVVRDVLMPRRSRNTKAP